MRVGDNLSVQGAAHDASSAAACLTFWPATPVRVLRWGFVVTVVLVGDGIITLTHSPYIAAGTTTPDATAGTTGTGTITTPKAGTVQYVEPTTGVLCKPADSLIMTVTNAWTSGTIVPFIQYQPLNWDDTGENAAFADATMTFGKLVDVSTTA
jgi:hypothetical protein